MTRVQLSALIYALFTIAAVVNDLPHVALGLAAGSVLTAMLPRDLLG